MLNSATTSCGVVHCDGCRKGALQFLGLSASPRRDGKEHGTPYCPELSRSLRRSAVPASAHMLLQRRSQKKYERRGREAMCSCAAAFLSDCAAPPPRTRSTVAPRMAQQS
eukprot:6205674-Pleurochrysis_carterae.AAC.1